MTYEFLEVDLTNYWPSLSFIHNIEFLTCINELNERLNVGMNNLRPKSIVVGSISMVK